MYIEIVSLSEFWSNGEKVKLPANLVRYIEFDKIVALLLRNNDSNNRVVGIEFSQGGGINHHFIRWEFQIVDGLGEIHDIVEMNRVNFGNKEVLYCRGWGFDIGYYIDPDTGEVLHTEPTR